MLSSYFTVTIYILLLYYNKLYPAHLVSVPQGGLLSNTAKKTVMVIKVTLCMFVHPKYEIRYYPIFLYMCRNFEQDFSHGIHLLFGEGTQSHKQSIHLDVHYYSDITNGVLLQTGRSNDTSNGGICPKSIQNRL